MVGSNSALRTTPSPVTLRKEDEPRDLWFGRNALAFHGLRLGLTRPSSRCGNPLCLYRFGADRALPRYEPMTLRMAPKSKAASHAGGAGLGILIAKRGSGEYVTQRPGLLEAGAGQGGRGRSPKPFSIKADGVFGRHRYPQKGLHAREQRLMAEAADRRCW